MFTELFIYLFNYKLSRSLRARTIENILVTAVLPRPIFKTLRSEAPTAIECENSFPRHLPALCLRPDPPSTSSHTLSPPAYTHFTMMKIAAATALLAGSAAAFAPAANKATSVTSLNAFENEIGAQAPLGLYDPLGLLEDADQERFDRLRYVEIKHGRISQLAFLGQIVTRAGLHLPGDINLSGDSFDSYPDGVAALFGEDAIPQAGLGQLILFVGILELFVMKDSANGAEAGDFPGDFRNGFLDFGWDLFDDNEKARKRGIELNNGRAAMMGILGLMVHEKLVDAGVNNPVIGLFIGYDA